MTPLRKIIASLVVVSFSLLHAAEPPPFSPLFNGRNLDGWVNVNCAPETFQVRDGMIHCDGIPTGALRTDRQFENFELELEWRHLKSGGNAGVFIWAGSLPAVGQPFLRAIEVQVLDHGYGKSDWFTTHGDIFPIHGSQMKPFKPSKGDRSFPRESLSKGTPEWNHYRIVATNGVIRLSVNGAEVSGGENCSWRKGFIALESEGGVVDWRNLKVREFPSSGATGSESAPKAEAWRSLYDGRSFNGWTLPKGPAELWQARDWTLFCGTNGAPSAVLTGVPSGGAKDLFFDWRWEAQPSQLVPPLELAVAGVSSRIVLPALPAAKPAAWNRVHLRRIDRFLEIRLNDLPAGRIPMPSGDFTPVLCPSQVPTRFASLFVK